METKETKVEKTTKKMTLRQKLLEIQKRVRGLGKDAKANTYNYVSGSKVLEQIRPAMDELGILLVQKVNSIDNTRIDYQVRNYDNNIPQAFKPKTEILSKVMMTFTWMDVDSDETIDITFGANGMNDFDKGLGSALTYAERYFLLKFFHIPTDEDDVDAQKPREVEPTPVKPLLIKGTGAWNKAVVRLAAGEDIRKQLADNFSIDEATWNQLENDVIDFKTNNNLK